MFNKTLLKAQQREIARLRRDLFLANRRIEEILDKFLFNKAPERIVQRNNESVPESLDPFTRAEQDAIRLTKERQKEKLDAEEMMPDSNF